MKKQVTIKDIAKKAGVSITTVSRVLNNNEKVASQEVRERIWQIVKEMNYIPNSAARKLKKGDNQQNIRTKTLGCLFARSKDCKSNPFFTEIARHIEHEAFRQGYIMKYSFSAYDINDPKIFQAITNHNVDGIAVLGRFNKQLLNFLNNNFKHVVYTGLNKIKNAPFDQVISDGYQAAMSAVNYLTELGHREIGYVGEIENEIRFKGYCDALTALGLPIKSENIIHTRYSSEAGYEVIKNYTAIKNNVTALFCGNDLTAIGVMKGLKEMGIKVPEDISIISIDNIETAQFVSPMLTTIHIPVEELGKFTAKILIERIENGKKLPVIIELPNSIVVRESCKKPAK